ncbi:STAS domain-containing protein [Rhodopila globiformis]|nr:STAS domain-containing protein [Rhodopila globiformis]
MAYDGLILRKSALLHHTRLRITIHSMFSVNCVTELWKSGLRGPWQTILRQQEAIRELSTPVLQLRERLLILPIIGLWDSVRAKQLTENLLRQVRDKRARVVVMDITGAPTVDSKVADHLIRSVAAARLMGARVIVTGLSAEVAQSLVTLGVDLSMLITVGDLQGGLEETERILGYETRRAPGFLKPCRSPS